MSSPSWASLINNKAEPENLQPNAPTFKPPETQRIIQIIDTFIARNPIAPELPQGIPSTPREDTLRASLLVVGESLGQAAADNLRKRGFRSAKDVDGLVGMLQALAERRYDAITIWGHVHEKTLRFVRGMVTFSGRATDPLVPLLASRVKDVPIVIRQSTGGYALFHGPTSWYLSEYQGPDWMDAIHRILSKK